MCLDRITGGLIVGIGVVDWWISGLRGLVSWGLVELICKIIYWKGGGGGGGRGVIF